MNEAIAANYAWAYDDAMSMHQEQARADHSSVTYLDMIHVRCPAVPDSMDDQGQLTNDAMPCTKVLCRLTESIAGDRVQLGVQEPQLQS